MAILGDEVFTVRAYSKQVEVHDAMSLALQLHITVPGTVSSSIGLVACARNHCIYMSDCYNSSINRVDLSVVSGYSVKSWSVSTVPAGLSVNMSHNLVVACIDIS